jgi:hypothetical protein
MHRVSKLPTLVFAFALVASCRSPDKSDGERLAHTYCAACHAFPDPSLLDKQTWRTGVLPQMVQRLSGPPQLSVAQPETRSPYMTVLTRPVPEQDRDRIVAFYLEHAPDSLPPQTLPAEPGIDPERFRAGPFVTPSIRLASSAIITLLYADTADRRIYVGEAATNLLRVFGWDRRLITTLQLPSPPTGVIAEGRLVLVLESGILEPNDEPRGSLVQYDVGPDGALHFNRTIIDSLFRPVFVREFDADGDGRNDFLIAEFGDNRGRLALYRSTGSGYERRVLDATPGAIRFELHDLTGDGRADIVALFGQGDERIVLYPADGTGRFTERRVLARFPPVYGSMYFTMRDFNGDGALDILYVNGDNYDMSRVRKPFHGVRILENDGANNFTERFFFPVYGAAQAAVADFDRDGRLDLVVTSNFADPAFHPERGIMFLQNTGAYTFQPYAFSVSAGSQWNLTTTADFDGDGRLDVLIGAMRLENIARLQRGRGPPAERSEPLLLFENRARGRGPGRRE